MIYDCFLFNGEIEVALIRFNEFHGMPVCHVVIEGAETFSGRKKTPSFPLGLMEKFNIKYTCFGRKYSDLTPIEREKKFRQALKGALPRVEVNDIVIWTDVDEIPKVSRFGGFYHSMGIAALQMFHHVGWLNWRRHDFIYRPKIMAGRVYNEICPHEARWMECDYVIPEAGWHFSYLGGVDQIEKRINDGAHRQNNDTADKMLERYRKFGIQKCENFAMQVPLVAPHLPAYVIQNEKHLREIGYLL